MSANGTLVSKIVEDLYRHPKEKSCMHEIIHMWPKWFPDTNFRWLPIKWLTN